MYSKTSNPPVIVRRDEKYSQIPELLSLIREAFAYMQDRIDPPSSMHLLNETSLTQKCREETLFTATIDDHLVGCAFAKEYQDYIYVGKLAVSQCYQGAGIGQKLLFACRDHALELGKPVLEIQVRVELTENHRFFQNLGFVKTGESAHAGYDRPTSYTFRLNIKNS
ncbi:GNAT family N-acetyltransferase [Sneathiella glossodoripedis]|uniref:GNAT family N-acetyltransferase n=1 Tax=Sneathiella glossodoripedis TaxID=418853 RepID=UPI000470645D|nr:GNAT family N-acetyltransferase [Sneathiella glossodoripedis]